MVTVSHRGDQVSCEETKRTRETRVRENRSSLRGGESPHQDAEQP